MGELGCTLHRRGRTLRSYSCGEKGSYGCGASYVRSHAGSQYMDMAFENPNSAIVKRAIQTQSGNRFTHAEWGFLSPLFRLSQTFWVSPLGRIFASCQWTQATQPNTSQLAERNLKETCHWLVAGTSHLLTVDNTQLEGTLALAD